MDFKRIKHSEIDFKKWDEVVNASEFPALFANSFFLNAVSPGWEALVFGDYTCVFPLCIKKKYSLEYLPQPLFTGQLGLFGTFGEETETLLYDYLFKHFKLIEYELNCTHRYLPKEVSTMRTYIIRYGRKIEYNQNTKRNISKAKNLKLQVVELEKKLAYKLSGTYLNPFLKEHLGFNSSAVKLFEQLLQEFDKAGKLMTFAVYDKSGKIRALAHFIFTPKYAVYLKGTNFDKKENSGSMHFLMDHAIREFRQENRIFDFGGGTLPGIGNFFRGLGGEALIYKKLNYSSLPKWTHWFKKNKTQVLE